MLKVHLVLVGDSKKGLYSTVESEFEKRLQRFCKLKTTVIPNFKGRMNAAEIKQREAEKIREVLKGNSWVALDEGGKQFNSEGFANWIENQMMGQSELIFVIGGAEGFDKELLAEAKMKLSLSAMTFTHQMIRGIFLEQLYRAFTIIKGHPYHNS